MTKPRLKPCPFCGKVGSVSPGCVEPIWFDHKKGCWLYPSTSLYRYQVPTWNRRAPQGKGKA